MPNVHSLESHVQIVAAWDKVGNRGGDDDEQRLGKVRAVLLIFPICLTKIQGDEEEEQSIEKVDEPILIDQERDGDIGITDSELIVNELHDCEWIEASENDAVIDRSTDEIVHLVALGTITISDVGNLMKHMN